MRIGIMGAGSLGTILGAYISKAGIPIDLIDVYKEHVDALNKNGAHITGTVDFTAKVKALTPDQMTGTYDLIFYMAKQTYNKEAFASLRPHITDKTTIVTFQNGLPERAVVKEFGEDRVMGCPVGWGATFKGPGNSDLTSHPDHMSFDLGRVTGKITPDMDEIKKILETMCPTLIVSNLMGIRWTKVLTNATFSGMSAAMACSFGDVMDDPKSFKCVQYIANECIKVGRAAKIKMEPMFGVDLGTLLAWNTDEEREKTAATIIKMWTPHRLLRASMLQDLEKGRKCEIFAINGVVCDMGKELNIPTPVNDQVVAIVKQVEEGKLKLGNHLDLFKL